jgi:hypothetical protein
MSTIPPNWMSSVIGAQDVQRNAATARNKDAADEASRSSNAPFAERLQNVIENSDRDSEVYADAEGTGSQGRPSSQESEEQPAETEHEEDTPTAGGLDIQA